MSIKKPWSITTTVRNPNRIIDFLRVLSNLAGSTWDKDNQVKFQVLLTQHRLYRPQSDGIPIKLLEKLNDPDEEISFNEAQSIFDSKNYEDPPMRGRNSYNPLKKFGLATTVQNKVRITELGELLLSGNLDIGQTLFRSLLKWQLPNLDVRGFKKEDGYNIKPFLATLHLIKQINQIEEERGNKAKGISRKEFNIFVPTLINYNDIESQAKKIIELRDILEAASPEEQGIQSDSFCRKFLINFLGEGDDTKTEKDLSNLFSNLSDYGDNTIRYFRMTRYVYLRGNGYYIDLEPRRSIETNLLLENYDASVEKFQSKEEYLFYLSNFDEPQLPWETKEKYIEIIEKLTNEIHSESRTLADDFDSLLSYNFLELGELKSMELVDLEKYLSDLRSYRLKVYDYQIKIDSRRPDNISNYIENLKYIVDKKSDATNRPVLLERFVTLGMQALNDAIKIKPNYPVGDDNIPTFTAPGNVPDIECFYDKFNAICEVTMLTSRDQWVNEGQPVMRHLRDFEDENNSKPAFCLFIAPKLHRDTVNTFWTAVKYEYEGEKQCIVPLTIEQFIIILEMVKKISEHEEILPHEKIYELFESIASPSSAISDSIAWIKIIPEIIANFERTVLGDYNEK